MKTIPGLKGAHEPAYMTRDRRLVSMDRLVEELVPLLREDGMDISYQMVKCCLQASRRILARSKERLAIELLCDTVSRELRTSLMLLRPPDVQRVLTAYAALIAQLEVIEIT